MRTSADRHIPLRHDQRGFTILELMIATMVFSVILLVVAAGILSFTKQYIKGITSSNTQTVARAIMADVVQNIQFSSGTVRHNALLDPEQYCVGNVAYYIVRGQKVTVTQHGLVQEVGSCSATGITLSPLGTLSSTQHEMLSQNMRIAEFSIDQPNSSSTSATVTVTVVSGDYDMFTDKNGTVLASEAAAPTASFDWGSVHCKSGAGSQFCGVSRLTTFVQGRIGS